MNLILNRWSDTGSIQYSRTRFWIIWVWIESESPISAKKKANIIMNAYLPSFFTMVMTIASLFLDNYLHFSTTIMLVLTSQLCLYTLFQSSLEGIPKTGYVKFIDYWSMFTMTITLSNFFTLFFWEVIRHKGINNRCKTITRIILSLITLIGLMSYLIMAGLLYFGFND